MNEFSDNKELGQYELTTDSGKAVLEYSLDGDVINLLHTIVPVADRGQGVAAKLVRAALDDARQRERDERDPEKYGDEQNEPARGVDQHRSVTAAGMKTRRLARFFSSYEGGVAQTPAS